MHVNAQTSWQCVLGLRPGLPASPLTYCTHPTTRPTSLPLQIHLTKEPLVEEYSVAAQVGTLICCSGRHMHLLRLLWPGH